MHELSDVAAPIAVGSGPRRAWAGAFGAAAGLARARGADKGVPASITVGTEHLLLGLAGQPGVVGHTLTDAGVTRRSVGAVLRSKGVDPSSWVEPRGGAPAR